MSMRLTALAAFLAKLNSGRSRMHKDSVMSEDDLITYFYSGLCALYAAHMNGARLSRGVFYQHLQTKNRAAGGEAVKLLQGRGLLKATKKPKDPLVPTVELLEALEHRLKEDDAKLFEIYGD